VWASLTLFAVNGCHADGVASTVRDGSLGDARQEIETLGEDGPKSDFVDSLAEWRDQSTDEEQRDAGLEDLPRMDRVDVGMQTDVSPMDGPEDRQDMRDVYRGDAGVFRMGPVRHVSAKDDLTCVVRVRLFWCGGL